MHLLLVSSCSLKKFILLKAYILHRKSLQHPLLTLFFWKFSLHHLEIAIQLNGLEYFPIVCVIKHIIKSKVKSRWHHKGTAYMLAGPHVSHCFDPSIVSISEKKSFMSHKFSLLFCCSALACLRFWSQICSLHRLHKRWTTHCCFLPPWNQNIWDTDAAILCRWCH